jgi:hypothetical protein
MTQDLRELPPGKSSLGTLDTCPVCGKTGMWVRKPRTGEVLYAHVVDPDRHEILEACTFPKGGLS